MSTTNTDQKRVVETGRSIRVYTIAFHPDGMHILSGGDDGVKRWRLADCQEMGRKMNIRVYAISVSVDGKWIVCGTRKGASVWDGEMDKKVIDVEGRNPVVAVDISPDSASFATGTGLPDNKASIWSITIGKRLVGPLQHDERVTGIKFSPDGERIATACYGGSIRIFNSRNGDELVTINTTIPEWSPTTPFAWSSDGWRIFCACRDNRIRAFDSTGSQLTESLVLGDGSAGHNVYSIVLAASGKFITYVTGQSVSFLAASTLEQIDPVIMDSRQMRSIAISADSRYLAAGDMDGKLFIHDLGNIPPGSYGPLHVPGSKDAQQDKQPSTLSGHDNEVLGLPIQQEDRGKSDPLESKGRDDDDGDLLEHEAPSSMPAPQSFDYDESLSQASSDHLQEDAIPPVSSSRPISRSSEVLPATSTPEAQLKEKPDTGKSRHGHSIFEKWLPRSVRDPTSQKSKDRQTPSDSPVGVDATNEGPSWMAAGKRKRRAVAVTVRRSQNKSTAKPAVPKKQHQNTSRPGQSSANAQPADPVPVQQPIGPSQPLAGRVHVTHQQGSANATVAFTIPAWMVCVRRGTEDGTH